MTYPDVDPNMSDHWGYQHYVGTLDPAAAAGAWVLIDPLPPGEHTVSFLANFDGVFFIGANYTIIVEE